MGDVIVLGVNAADEALQEIVACKTVAGRFYQSRLVRNLVNQLLPSFDTDDDAVLLINGLGDKINELLCLPEPFKPMMILTI
jgi:hypothetical protein